MNEAAAHTVLPGRRLQVAREKMGWSEAEVAKRLHMSVTFVRAIEADDYERLPEAMFIKGYMRNYARLLEIPADEVANLFEQLVEEDEQPQELAQSVDESSSSRSWPLVAVAAVLAAAVLAWMVWPEADTQQADQAQVMPDTSTAEAVDEPIEPVQAAEPLQQAQAPEPAEAPAPELSEPVPTAPSAAPVADTLAVVFNGPCWVQVLDADGETLFSGQRDANNSLTLSGKAPFRFTFGNGSAVSSLAVNGESVTLPQSTPGNVVRVRAP